MPSARGTGDEPDEPDAAGDGGAPDEAGPLVATDGEPPPEEQATSTNATAMTTVAATIGTGAGSVPRHDRNLRQLRARRRGAATPSTGVYVTPESWETPGSVRRLDEVEHWCFACCTHYPHEAVED